MSPTEEHIASILRLRRARSEILGEGLFADIGWDILLELFAARLAGRAVRLSELNISGARSTVARWAAALEERGLIACGTAPLESADLWLELSDSGFAKMEGLFDPAPSELGLLP